ncbi:MAG: TIM barrel protein, partial [Roseiflexaceae bacterium]
LNFDISHFNVMGIPIAESVAALAQHTVHTHVKDERGVVPDFEFLIPGEGEFDYVAYLQAMHAHGYAGFITAEISIMVQRRPGYDPLAAAEQTYRTLAHAFEQAGVRR